MDFSNTKLLTDFAAGKLPEVRTSVLFDTENVVEICGIVALTAIVIILSYFLIKNKLA